MSVFTVRERRNELRKEENPGKRTVRRKGNDLVLPAAELSRESNRVVGSLAH